MIRTFAEMIKFEHSVFALPFALVGMLYAAGGWPGWKPFLLILIAMVAARTAAMTFNRIADRQLDAKNARTRNRALPAGRISLRAAWGFLLASVALFFASAALLNSLALLLSPLALAILLGYSYTKRFTPLCHLFVGLALGIAPAAAWVAVKGVFSWTPLFWILTVMFWTAGFDVLYALQDETFDKAHNLKSIPAALGRAPAIAISRLFHVLAIVFAVCAGIVVSAGLPYYVGCAFAACLLTYEQSLVSPANLSKLDVAFFTMNGYVSIAFGFFAILDVLTMP